jgi:hypothetical protein
MSESPGEVSRRGSVPDDDRLADWVAHRSATGSLPENRLTWAGSPRSSTGTDSLRERFSVMNTSFRRTKG